MNLSKLSTLFALSSVTYYPRVFCTSAHSVGGGLVVSTKFYVSRNSKRFKSLKSRSNRRKASRSK